MQPLNPFLAAFFKSSVVAQCTPVHHHVLLVPLTDVLLTYRETESGGAPASEVIASDEFLASHVLRIPGPSPSASSSSSAAAAAATAAASAKDRDAVAPNLRDVRGKAKQFSTLNGRTVVVKDAFVYSNKGFKTLAQAQILTDTTWYPDVLEPRQWLLYFISKPLVGTWVEVKIAPAVLVHGVRSRSITAAAQQQDKAPAGEAPDGGGAVPRKKDIRSFHDLLNHFPMIARQMQPGLERLFLDFTTAFHKPLPSASSASSMPGSLPDRPGLPREPAAKTVRSSSFSTPNGSQGPGRLPVAGTLCAEDDEDVMRASLETAVTAAIDLFQGVDKQQLSLLGATTELTGPLVEKLIERYVTENLHHLMFPRLSGLKRPEDLELESRIRRMDFIDISQLGIAIGGRSPAKHHLLLQLGPVIEEFKKISSARSPGEMMAILLSTTKTVSQLTQASDAQGSADHVASSEKAMMTVNADTLVSLLLFVVIRSQVRNLQARLLYVRNFIFIDDVDSGEMGYALSTFEAVLTYLTMDSAGLRRASRRNKALWDAVKKGKLDELRNIMEPSTSAVQDDEDGDGDGDGDENDDDDDDDDDRRRESSRTRRRPSLTTWSLTNGSSMRSSSLASTASDRFSRGSGLGHVFPFQANGNCGGDLPPVKRVKKVAMDTRSLSSGSEMSFHSRTASIGTIGSTLEGDITVERLAQTSDAFGESVLMMAVQNKQTVSLRYLLSLSGHYPLDVVLEDVNNEDTTLLSAAVQLGHAELIATVLDHVSSLATSERLAQYIAEQDIWGRSIGHYLFHAPWLMGRIGRLIPWRQRDKNGQTPLFALCRSYDHADYYDMVEAGLTVAREAQGDGQPLHIDNHVDGRGNTLLHIINDARLAMRMLHCCDVDVNATNDKRFTALMVASKYGRYDMVRCLFADPRVDVAARELRGLTAVELAKDDDVRNKIDDLGLFSMPAGRDGRITGVVRAFFVEDGSVRLVLKSAAPTDHDSYTVTTSRRSLAEFERLARLLAVEHPASWIPPMTDTRSPFQLPTKPSRAVLRDIQARAGWFLRIMLGHPTLATHEMLWEFFLVPELQLDAMEQRTRLKVETRVDKIRDEYEPVEDVREVEQFVNHAGEMVRSVGHSTRGVTRRVNGIGLATSDLYDSMVLLHRQVAAVEYAPSSHVRALETYFRAMAPAQSSPQAVLHSTLLAMQSTVQALLSSLSRPATLISRISAAKREADRNETAAGRSSRWPLGLLDETRQRLQDSKEQRARKSRQEAEYLSRELRHTQQTVAAELAGWQDMHEKMGRRAMREFARGMVVQERMKLDGMMRALRRVRPDEAARDVEAWRPAGPWRGARGGDAMGTADEASGGGAAV